MNEKIKELIKNRKPSIDESTLVYFSNYFSIVAHDNLLPDGVSIESIIDNTLEVVDRIVFYDDNSEVYKKLGSRVKGLCDHNSKTLYIRGNLDDVLKEITIYHEIHHAAQTNRKNNQVGVNHVENLGRLIMEGQTQYMAEKVYQEIHGVNFEYKFIPSEELRMKKGGLIKTNLHNYQLYENLLRKLAIMLNVDMDYFVRVNFLYNNYEGIMKIEKKYNKAKEKFELPKSFGDLLFDLDYIYCVDLVAYIDGKESDLLLAGKELPNDYTVYTGHDAKFSLKEQYEKILLFDRENILSLLSNGGNATEFVKYVVDNNLREMLEVFLVQKTIHNSTE